MPNMNQSQSSELNPQNAIPVVVGTLRIAMILSAMSVFGPFATDMYLSSFPDIAQSLSTTQSMVQLTLALFLIGLATGQLIYGPLADSYGRRRPLLVGVGVFFTASLLASLAPNIETLIALRFVQAAGGCAGMVIARAIIRDLYSVGESARVMSLVVMVQSLGPIIAPTTGGLLLLVAGWRSMFVVMTLLGAFCFVLVLRGLPETLPPERRIALSFGNMFQAFGRLLRKRAFIIPALSGSVAMSCMFAFIAGSPFVFMQIHGVSPQHYGFLFAITSLGLFGAAHINRLLLRRYKPAQIFRIVLYVNAGAALCVVLVASTTSLALLMLPLLVCVATVPMILANASAIAMGASGSDVGSASSIYGLMQFGLASITSSLIGVFHNGTAYPMAGMMLGVSVVGNLVYLCRVREAHD